MVSGDHPIHADMAVYLDSPFRFSWSGELDEKKIPDVEKILHVSLTFLMVPERLLRVSGQTTHERWTHR
jgi:hypothetical protein